MSSMFSGSDGSGAKDADRSTTPTEEANGFQQSPRPEEVAESTTEENPWETIHREALKQTLGLQEAHSGARESYSASEEVNLEALTQLLSEELNIPQLYVFGVMTDPDYNIYKIRQGKTGKVRTIEEPEPVLKAIQKYLINFFDSFPLSTACTARKGSSALRNASLHRYAKHLLKIDIKNCYPSTTREQIETAILLAATRLDYHQLQLLRQALKFCVLPNGKGQFVLPTGAPTSPILCNIALTPLDLLIQKYLKDHFGDKYIYTRYLDDIIISTPAPDRDWIIKTHVETLIKTWGWKVNVKKSKWFTSNEQDKLIVTGVRVGDTYGCPREFHRQVRARLNNLVKAGRDIDAETQGCLAYIRSIDEPRYHQLLDFYQRRKELVSS